MVMGKPLRGQISLEFMLVFGLMMFLLIYSINNATFSGNSASVQILRTQIGVEEKTLANAISNAISQVYAQGPGSKATVYVSLVYLRNSEMLRKGLGVETPMVFITFGNYSTLGNGTYVAVAANGSEVVLTGGDKTAFWSRSLYSKNLYSRDSIWNPLATVKFGSMVVYGIGISPDSIPPSLRIVAEWNPDLPNGWSFDPVAGEIRININPGD